MIENNIDKKTHAIAQAVCNYKESGDEIEDLVADSLLTVADTMATIIAELTEDREQAGVLASLMCYTLPSVLDSLFDEAYSIENT